MARQLPLERRGRKEAEKQMKRIYTILMTGLLTAGMGLALDLPQQTRNRQHQNQQQQQQQKQQKQTPNKSGDNKQMKGKRTGPQDGTGPMHTPGTGGGSGNGGGARRGGGGGGGRR
jgi:hypothetical protein